MELRRIGELNGGSEMTDLPIDLVPGRVRMFRWQQTTETPLGRKTVTHEEALNQSAEDAVANLVKLARAQQQEIAGLRRQVEGLADRVAAQSDLLSKKAEAQATKGRK